MLQFLTLLYSFVLFYFYNVSCDVRYINGTMYSEYQCPEFDSVDFASIKYITEDRKQYAVITCVEGYDITGMNKIMCGQGVWEGSRPTCIKRCHSPPFVKNGALEIEGEKDSTGLFKKGSLATYSCGDGFKLIPPESKYRVCEKGIWTGPVAKCVSITDECTVPKAIPNGYYIKQDIDEAESSFFVGQRIQYKCNMGYSILGYSILQCLQGGVWSTKELPRCQLRLSALENENPCFPLAPLNNTVMTVTEGFQSEVSAFPGTVLELRCVGRYRNTINPCRPSIMKCLGGRWVGTLPNCVIARDCYAPPLVSYASVMNVNFDIYDSGLPPSKYPIKSQVSYQCRVGYELKGIEVITCSMDGCWIPNNTPKCVRSRRDYYLDVDSFNAFLVSAGTGVGVMTLLILICATILIKRKKNLSNHSLPVVTPVINSEMSDHATLLNNPDRLALIAFADGIQNNNQDALPSYDEAVRRNNLHVTGRGISRPAWANIPPRRARNSPDVINVARHGSFASHTPSTRSGADSMGSTDTVAISEGSTNVTLDTASSHSGSQAPSCRAHCGSLASFDTSSVINIEGAPLLEENEMEENMDNNESVDGYPISENSSFKSNDPPSMI